MNRKSTTRGNDNTAQLKRDALLLFRTVNDQSIHQDVRNEIMNWLDAVFNSSVLTPQIEGDERFFTTCFVDGMERMPRRDFFRSRAQQIIDGLKRGEKAEEIIARIDKEGEEHRAKLKTEELNIPEPKDKTSHDWRIWKLRQLKRGLESNDLEVFKAASAEYRALIRGLVNDSNFYHVPYALALLPHLLLARQEIDALIAREKRLTCQKKGGAR